MGQWYFSRTSKDLVSEMLGNGTVFHCSTVYVKLPLVIICSTSHIADNYHKLIDFTTKSVIHLHAEKQRLRMSGKRLISSWSWSSWTWHQLLWRQYTADQTTIVKEIDSANQIGCLFLKLDEKIFRYSPNAFMHRSDHSKAYQSVNVDKKNTS